MKQFFRVLLEISNRCSAKCTYCSTGRNKGIIPGTKEKFMPVSRFESIIKKLNEHNVYASGSNHCVNLYNWGEPFLHPEFAQLAEILRKNNTNYAVSTNAAQIPEITKDLVSNMLSCRISMPGFSKESYAKIQKLNFSQAIKNIECLVHGIRKYNSDTVITISYHVYQFNCVHELPEAAEFARKLNVRFEPISAFINDFDLDIQYQDGKIPYKQMKKMGSELFLGHMKYKKNDYCAMWDKFLVIDVAGDVILCCGTHENHKKTDHGSSKLGNFLTDKFDEILKEKNKSRKKEFCKFCLSYEKIEAIVVWPQVDLCGVKSTAIDIFEKRVEREKI